VFNVSAMSYGALSDNAILSLNGGAKLGNFYHNTGEGGISSFHKAPGGDIVWNIGTGYFGCRDATGHFSEEKFKENASLPQVRMIEVKLSQGAKPGHGGILPKSKVTNEIANARGVNIGEDCISPPIHSAFVGPEGLVKFIAKLRLLSGGKPIGFKLCVGHPAEVASIVQAMVKLNITPDFITVDGGEGGTGAAPQEYSNHVGTPLIEGLTLVDNLLRGAGVRDRVKIISAGKVYSGFSLVRHLAIGADICNAARAMMYALGCIQALKCNTNKCPTGVATQDRELMQGLDVDDKTTRVYQFHQKTIEAAADIIGSVGLDSPQDLRREHLWKRISPQNVLPYSKLFPYVPEGCLVRDVNSVSADKRAKEVLLQLQDIWTEGGLLLERTLLGQK